MGKGEGAIEREGDAVREREESGRRAGQRACDYKDLVFVSVTFYFRTHQRKLGSPSQSRLRCNHCLI